MPVSLDTQGIELDLITGATGSPFEAAKMCGVLRCVASSFNTDAVSSDERIGRNVICKMKLCWLNTSQRHYGINGLFNALHLNRPECATIKTLLFNWYGSGGRKFNWKFNQRYPNASIIDTSAAFRATKWFIENHGGWSAYEMRIERQKESAAKKKYLAKKRSLQSDVLGAKIMKKNDASKADSEREMVEFHTKILAELHDKLEYHKRTVEKAGEEIDALDRAEKQRVKWKSPKRKAKNVR